MVLCVVYIKNRCPSHAFRNKTPYEMWYGHIPSVMHLNVFGSSCYSFIPKEQIKKSVQRVTNVSSLGTYTYKEYHLYDEVNKKFIISRDVIFLESSKIDNVFEWQLNHLDRFEHANYFQEFDSEIPHLLLLALCFLWRALKKSGWRKFLPLLCQERTKRLLAVGSKSNKKWGYMQDKR